MSRYEDQAKQAAAIVIGLLNGKAPSAARPAMATRIPIVDWRQVHRWGIDERLLPADTIVRFREPSAWDKYWRGISVGVAVVLLQAALITALLLERRSRRQTAAALEESQKQMTAAASAARLSLWIWDAARKKHWREWATAATLRRAAGYGDSFRGRCRVGASFGPRKSPSALSRTALSTDEEFDVEYRVAEADGSVRWFAARGRAERVGSQRLLGVALDVTERKAAELRAAAGSHRTTPHDAGLDDWAALSSDRAPAEPAACSDTR